MLSYIIRRIIQIIPLMIVISVISFVIIELPPGDFLTSRIANLKEMGTEVGREEIARLEQQYGLDKPLYHRYVIWLWKIIRHGDFGRSFQWEKPVAEVVRERLALTLVLSVSSFLFVWIVAIPIGIYSATHQYSFWDYIFTFGGFAGLAIPNFLLALVLMWLSYVYFDFPITSLFSPEYLEASWSAGKIIDMLKHLWVPVIVIGTAGTASLIRIMRGCLLDELAKQYVITARSKGLSETRILFKYPVRVAINPLVSTIGWLLPQIVSGGAITAIVLNLPTMGPLLVQALMVQDMYVAGSVFLLLSGLTLIGTLVSDILLVWIDPRISYKKVVS